MVFFVNTGMKLMLPFQEEGLAWMCAQEEGESHAGFFLALSTMVVTDPTFGRMTSQVIKCTNFFTDFFFALSSPTELFFLVCS